MIQLMVPYMTCSVCGNSTTKAIQAIDERAIVDADPKTKLVKVETQASEAAIKAAVTDADYTAA